MTLSMSEQRALDKVREAVASQGLSPTARALGVNRQTLAGVLAGAARRGSTLEVIRAFGAAK
jgi:hypothetical protein